MKTCTKCGVEKLISDYYFVRGKPRALCKLCNKSQNKLYAKSERGRELNKVHKKRYLNTESGKLKRHKEPSYGKYKKSEKGRDMAARSYAKCAFESRVGVPPPEDLLETMVLQSKIRRQIKRMENES